MKFEILESQLDTELEQNSRDNARALRWDAAKPKNLGDLLRYTARRSPQKPAVIYGDRIVSYEGLDTMTDALAHFLIRNGLSGGDRVAIHWPNSAELVSLYFACFKAGLIAVPINIRLNGPEIAHILRESGATVCFTQAESALLCEEARADCPFLKHIFWSLPCLDRAESDVTLPDVAPDRVAAILYTTGTTALPKGVMHTHASLMAASGVMPPLAFDQIDVRLAATQMAHTSAIGGALLSAIAKGGTAVLLPTFDAAQCLDLIERWRCSYVFLLPPMLPSLVEEQARRPRDVNSLKLCLAGGDTVPVSLQNRFRTLFGIHIQELYGTTEVGAITCIPEGAPRPGSVGLRLESVEGRPVDRAGNVVVDRPVGELQVRSPGNCVGYWNDGERTAAAFGHGWLRTGDLMRRDADGFFWFEGRAKQIVVHGGSNVSPQEVEEALYFHPSVRQAGVIGLPDPVYGENVIACVAFHEGLTSTEQELQNLIRSRIADDKVPEPIVFLPMLPEDPTGEVDRLALKKLTSACVAQKEKSA